MGLELEQASVVLVARQHNPSLLNPDFLRLNGIVPGDWKTKNPPITTEVFAQTTFREGLQFTAEPDKVAITAAPHERTDLLTTLKSAAGRYVDVLPHVPYTAVGLNAIHTVSIDDLDPDAVLPKKIFNTQPERLTHRGVKPQIAANLTYTFDDYNANVSINPGRVKNEGSTKPVLIFSINGHHKLPEKEGASAAKSIINQLYERIDEFKTLVTEVFDLA